MQKIYGLFIEVNSSEYYRVKLECRFLSLLPLSFVLISMTSPSRATNVFDFLSRLSSIELYFTYFLPDELLVLNYKEKRQIR